MLLHFLGIPLMKYPNCRTDVTKNLSWQITKYMQCFAINILKVGACQCCPIIVLLALWHHGEWTRGDCGSWRLPCLCAANQAFDTCSEINCNPHQTFSINKAPATLLSYTHTPNSSRSALNPASLSPRQKWLAPLPWDCCLASLLKGLCDGCIISAICNQVTQRFFTCFQYEAYLQP